MPRQLPELSKLESYRKKEKSLGLIVVVVDDENFFQRDEHERRQFLQESILKKLEVADEITKKKKLDTDINLLLSDVKKYSTPLAHNTYLGKPARISDEQDGCSD